MSVPGQFSDLRVPALFVLGLLGLLALSAAAVWVALGRYAARLRRDRPAPSSDRVWHPQESVTLTPAEEDAFDEVVSHLTFGARR
ncbi:MULTISPECIES: hypothetical protein [Streptomyces]|uniref:Secreted protein n=1 Tax=Streptomyces solicathayae TaxID=3081768 RepID=A0ABZ0LTM0_9ACTN|nr:hypothetical protein [Streptomyces sp. HUAS YS2]WOX22842.1 hypothetical protein R2D22_16120 [Streptomyces sp. HUAS YS2]